jgi:hypothetical protein
MSEAWTSLLSGVVGALVGGAASLAGTMLVNKQQMATNARMRLHYELVPNLESAMESAIDPQVPEDQVAEEVMPELLARVRRASSIAGPFERKAAHNLELLWSELQGATRVEIPTILRAEEVLQSFEEPTPEDEARPDSYAERQAKAEAIASEIREEIRALSDHLEAKLG